MAENVITYETLFEFLRLEKTRHEIQKLDDDFFKSLLVYLREKQTILDDNSKDNLFSGDEKEKTVVQIQQIKKILKDFYEKREKKIIDLALLRSRTSSSIINSDNLLKEEKIFFESLLKVFDSYRVSILDNLLNNNFPTTPEMQLNQKCVEESSKAEESKTVNKTVKFRHAVPQFMGTNLEVYGPFEEGDVANLPEKIVSILQSKDRVDLV